MGVKLGRATFREEYTLRVCEHGTGERPVLGPKNKWHETGKSSLSVTPEELRKKYASSSPGIIR